MSNGSIEEFDGASLDKWTSAFSQDLLGSLIADAETKCFEVQRQMEAAQAAYDEGHCHGQSQLAIR